MPIKFLTAAWVKEESLPLATEGHSVSCLGYILGAEMILGQVIPEHSHLVDSGYELREQLLPCPRVCNRKSVLPLFLGIAAVTSYEW